VSPLLSIRDLTVSFTTDTQGIPRSLRAVDGVSIDVPAAKTVAIVGESGSGKSTLALAILRLLSEPPARVERGEILFEGADLLRVPERELRKVRGGRIGMIFQEPMTSLNPVYTVGFQIMEAVHLHQKVSRAEARGQAIDGLARVGFPEPTRHLDSYPHELSGGMRQRVLIAMALACSPSLIVADEPTTALDATVQAQILELLATLRAQTSASMLLIAHDLALVSAVADELCVLYAGVVVERGPARAVLASAQHPYTRALLASVPPNTHRIRGHRRAKLPTIEGSPPDLSVPSPGCRFQDRCPQVFDRCRTETPSLFATGTDAFARCFLVETGEPQPVLEAGSSA
jgi:oligopeptide/dipeptide ABC transporter ATP-binding protein